MQAAVTATLCPTSWHRRMGNLIRKSLSPVNNLDDDNGVKFGDTVSNYGICAVGKSYQWPTRKRPTVRPKGHFR